eukprot:30547-Hanusia_phi.AAC.1
MEARASSAANFSDFMKTSVTRLSNFMKDTLNGPSSPVSHDRGTVLVRRQCQRRTPGGGLSKHVTNASRCGGWWRLGSRTGLPDHSDTALDSV